MTLRRLLLALAVLPMAAPAQAETLRIALAAPLVTLDPAQAVTVQTDLSIISDLYSPLITRGPDMQLAGVVAESWAAVDDRTWVFKLRPGLAFPDGEPLDAAAVKWNIDRVLDPKQAARGRLWYDPISRVEATSPTELRIETREPYPALPAQLSMFFLLAPNWTAAHTPATEAMGTGPYDLVSYAPGDKLVLKAKPGYFGPKPAFDQVVVRIITDVSARIAGVITGELDLATEIPPADIKRLGDKPHVRAGATAGARAMLIKINTFKTPFKDNAKLRRALNYAVDKQGLIDALYGSVGAPSPCQLLSPFYSGFNPELKPYPYDPAKARALIAESGVPTPVDVELEVPVGRYLLAEDMAQAIAAQLDEVGVHAELKEMDFSAWMNKYGPARDMGQLAILTQGWPTLDAGGFLGLYDPANPAGYWSDAPFMAALDKARHEMQAGPRDQLYRTATARMCAEAPVLFLFNPPVTWAGSDRITWQPRPDDWLRAFDVGLRG